MNNLCFNKSITGSYFTYDVNGAEEYIDYIPPIENIDNNIDLNEYSVELLINPILNGQSNVFALSRKYEGGKQTIGYVFPISALDSDQPIQKELANYYFAAFYTLLSRLSSVKEGDFSNNFEDNICVVVINKKITRSEYPLPLCIHSLRKYCYSYFIPYNHIRPIEGYTKERLMDNPNQKTLYVDMAYPKLYNHPMIDQLMKDLVYANNVTHRFVLLYQVIEFLMEDAIVKDIDAIYAKLNCHIITPTDYFEDVSHVSKEKTRIKNMFQECDIVSTPDFSSFRTACRRLLVEAGFNDDANNDGHELFYAFRNKMTHSYRRLYIYEHDLAEVIQYFERIVMLVIGLYPRYIV